MALAVAQLRMPGIGPTVHRVLCDKTLYMQDGIAGWAYLFFASSSCSAGCGGLMRARLASGSSSEDRVSVSPEWKRRHIVVSKLTLCCGHVVRIVVGIGIVAH